MKMTNAHKRTINALIHGRHCRKLVTRFFTSGRSFYTSLLSLLVAYELRRQPHNTSRPAAMPLLIANYTRFGTLIVATIYLQLIQNTYMFRSFTVLQCSHQHCVQPVTSDVEVVGYL